MTTQITLKGISYEVTDLDNQIIFDKKNGMSHCQMVFEWRSCGWYFVSASYMPEWGIFTPHIKSAIEWIEANYTIEWNDGSGTAHRIT